MIKTSYWLDTPYSPRPPLDKEIKVDIAVVGGGITGVSAAYHSAKQGFSTVLIEKDSVASGSAGKNGGMIVEGTEIDFIAALPDELDRQAWQETIKSRQYTASLIQEHNIDCDLTQPGSIYAARTEQEAIIVRREFEARQKYGIPCQLIEAGTQLRNSPFGLLLFNPADNSLHPVKFIRGLAKVAESFGVTIYEQTPALEVKENTIRTPNGIITAKKIVLATESGNTEIPATECVVERSQVILTEPLSDEVISQIDWPVGGMLWSGGANYASVRKVDNRLLIIKGMGLEEGSETQLLNTLTDFFPTLKQSRVDVSNFWNCPMLLSKRHRPFVGQRNGHYEVFGHGGNGLTNGIMMGKIMADFLSGSEIPLPYRM